MEFKHGNRIYVGLADTLGQIVNIEINLTFCHYHAMVEVDYELRR